MPPPKRKLLTRRNRLITRQWNRVNYLPSEVTDGCILLHRSMRTTAYLLYSQGGGQPANNSRQQTSAWIYPSGRVYSKGPHEDQIGSCYLDLYLVSLLGLQRPGHCPIDADTDGPACQITALIPQLMLSDLLNFGTSHHCCLMLNTLLQNASHV